MTEIHERTVNKIAMVREIDAVIFDLDGTLIDSMWMWPSIDEDYLNKYKLTAPDCFHEKIEGKSFTEVAALFLDWFPELPKTAEEVLKEWMDMAYDKYVHAVELKPGVQDFIRRMRGAGTKIGIATSNAMELVEATLHSLKVRNLFDSVHSACEVPKGKPSPDVYLLVAKEMSVSPDRCLVFEDVPMGILAGKNAGMRVCGVDDEFSRPQEARKRELADYYIQNYHDIFKETYEVL